MRIRPNEQKLGNSYLSHRMTSHNDQMTSWDIEIRLNEQKLG